MANKFLHINRSNNVFNGDNCTLPNSIGVSGRVLTDVLGDGTITWEPVATTLQEAYDSGNTIVSSTVPLIVKADTGRDGYPIISIKDSTNTETANITGEGRVETTRINFLNEMQIYSGGGDSTLIMTADTTTISRPLFLDYGSYQMPYDIKRFVQIADVDVNTSVVETSLIDSTGCKGTVNLPVGFWEIGRSFNLKMRGMVSHNIASVPTLTLRLKVGGIVVGSMVLEWSYTATSNLNYETGYFINIDVHCIQKSISLHSSGYDVIVKSLGEFIIADDTVPTRHDYHVYGGNFRGNGNVGDDAGAIDLTAEWNVSHVDNRITCEQCFVVG